MRFGAIGKSGIVMLLIGLFHVPAWCSTGKTAVSPDDSGFKEIKSITRMTSGQDLQDARVISSVKMLKTDPL